MENNEFEEKEYQFINDLKSSPLYVRMIELSKDIDEDKELAKKAKQRDYFYSKAINEEDENKKKEFYLNFKNIDDEIKEDNKVKEYLSIRTRLKKITDLLSDEIHKELF